MKKNEFFKLFACCILVKGYKGSLICDIQRSIFTPIENELLNVLTVIENYSISELKGFFPTFGHEKIDALIQYLVINDFGFITKNPHKFPAINLEWKSAARITNIIIDWGFNSKFDYENILTELNSIGCNALQLRCFSPISFNEIDKMLAPLSRSSVQAIELILPFALEHSIDENLENLVKRNFRLSVVYIYKASNKQLIKYRQCTFVFVEDDIPSPTCCGQISKNYFEMNVKLFTEAQHHNTCLNRKISIDTEGNIKNCPSMKENFGNIRDTTLLEALEKPGFKKYWNINKDQIEVCKDCEFRYSCTDCRAYLEDPDNIRSKPLKCGYNPYTCEWEEWSTNPLKQKAIEYYGMQGLVNKEQRQATAKPE